MFSHWYTHAKRAFECDSIVCVGCCNYVLVNVTAGFLFLSAADI